MAFKLIWASHSIASGAPKTYNRAAGFIENPDPIKQARFQITPPQMTLDQILKEHADARNHPTLCILEANLGTVGGDVFCFAELMEDLSPAWRVMFYAGTENLITTSKEQYKNVTNARFVGKGGEFLKVVSEFIKQLDQPAAPTFIKQLNRPEAPT